MNVHNWIDHLSRFQIFLVLTALGLLAYANAVNHPFVHDDVVFVQKNPYIADLNFKNIFFQTSVANDQFPLINQYYRPFLEFLNRSLYQIFGLNPHGFHFFNVILHILNSFLLFNVMYLITDLRKGISFTISIFFLLHPVQNEAVACISGISNLIFTFLCLLSFYAYLVTVRSKTKGRRILFYGVSLFSYCLALLAKEQAVIFPMLVAAYEIILIPSKQTENSKARWASVAGFFMVLGMYFLLRKFLFGFALTPTMDNKAEFWLRLLAIPRSLLTYFSLIIYPHDLHYYRSQDILLPFTWPLVILLGVILAIIWITYRMPALERRWMVFGLAWFIISILPTLNIVPLINEYSKILTAEHFLYFPVIGVFLYIAAFFSYWIEKIGISKMFPTVFAAMTVICVFFIGINIKQNTYWRAEIPLFERTLHYEKNFGRVRFLLAKAYAAQGDFTKAVVEDRKALEIMQSYERQVEQKKVKEFYLNFIKGIQYHLGYCLDILGDYAGSLEAFTKASELDPDNGAMHYTLGLNYLKLNDVNNAIIQFERALALNEEDLFAMNSLAICYQESGEYDKAERLLRLIVQKDNQSVSAQENLKNFLKKKQELSF